MSGFAAGGCNPNLTADTLAELGGAALGQYAFGSQGGVYRCVLAGEAISQYDLVRIEQLNEVHRASTGDGLGGSYAVAQVAIASGDYGWVLVLGTGTLRITGAVTDSTGTAGSIRGNGQAGAYQTTDSVLGMQLPTSSSTGSRNVTAHVMFAKKTT